MKKLLSLVLVSVFMLSSIATVSASEYVVKDGDVLWKIAKDNDTTVEAIVELNDISNKNLIYVNQVLTISEEAEVATPEPSKEVTVELSNVEKAVAVIESIGTTNVEPISYINANNYVQHNLAVKDGLAGFGELVAVLPEGSYGKNIRAFADGDMVIMHNEYDFFGPKVGFDIFRFENGLIVEHWDNLADIAEDVNASGRGQLDGTTVLKDLELTDTNKTIVEGFVNDVLMGAAPEKITDYVSTDKYFQHNTGVADGLDGLGEALAALAEAGLPMIYNENHFVYGQGNFVLAGSEGIFLGEEVAFYDLFRIEDGLIVEHWDVIENMLDEADHMNDNGKF